MTHITVRRAAFASSAPGLPGFNGSSQIYLKELTGVNAGRVTLISGVNSSSSIGGNDASTNPVISADGGTIAFESAASNLIVGDTNGRWDVFSRRTGPSGAQGDTSLVSVGAAGQGDGNSRTPSISSNGQFISFWSDSRNIATHNIDGQNGVYRATPTGGAVEVSDMHQAALVDPDSQAVFHNSWFCQDSTHDDQYFGGTRLGQHAIADDGTVVFTADWCRFGALHSSYCVGTYESGALFAALPSGVNNLIADCEDRKLQTDHLGSGSAVNIGGDPAISLDGSAVVVATDPTANNASQPLGLLSPLGGGMSILPLYHNQPIGGLQVTNGAGLVSFLSTSTNLVPHASSGRSNVYVVGGRVALISETPGGAEANGDSGPIAMTSDGQTVVFGSGASNLVTGDTNASWDAFKVDTPSGLGNFQTSTQPTSTDYWHLRDDEHFGCNRAEQYVADCHATAADPVDTATGNFHEDAIDFNISGRGFPLKVTRSYNSLDTGTEGAFGFGWTSNLDTRLVVEASGDVAVIQETGARARFHPRGSGFDGAPWNAATLTQTWPSGDYTFTQVNGDTYTFNSAGALTRVADRNSYAVTFAYDANAKLQTISELDASGTETGRTLSVAWTGNRITTITAPGTHVDPTNAQSPPLSVTYGHDGRGNLSSVVDVAGATWTFGYQDAANGHLLTNIRDPKQTFLNVTTKDVVNQYDGAGRVTTQTDNRGGRVTTFDYNATPISGSTTATKVTDPKGNVRVDYYDALNRRLFTTTGFGSAEAMTTGFTYDANTFALNTVANSTTGKTLLTLTYDTGSADRLGPFRLISSADALGHTTTWANFDRYNQPGEARDPAGTITTFTYSSDGKGNLTSVCRPFGTPTLQSPIRCTGASTDQITSIVLDSSNAAHPTDVIEVKDPTHQDTNPANAVRYGYDAYGYPNSVIDPLGDTTTFVYDNVGRLLSSVAPKGNKTGGNPAQYTTSYTVDAYGAPTAITDPLGHTQQRHFNKNHVVDSITDANNKTTTYTLDDLGQVGTIQRPDGTNLINSYYADGTLSIQVDGAGHTTSYTYDHLGRPQTTTDPDNRVTTNTYDQAGRLWTRTNAAGTTTYTYDDAGELKTTLYSGGTTPNITDATYDNLGHRLTLQTTAMTSSWTWDNLGRLTSSSETNGTVAYRWNLDNTLRAIAYPGGDCDSATTKQCVTRHYDNAERLDQITDWNGKTTAFHADENGNYDTITFPTTTADVDTASFDRADQVTGYAYKQGTTTAAAITYQRRNDNSLSQTTWNGLAGTSPENYGYDNLDRLCYVAGTAGTNPTCTTPPAGATGYGFDTADNLTSLPGGGTGKFDPANQLCYSVPAGAATAGCTTPPSGATTYGYDERGNRTSVTGPSGASTSMGYDAESRLTSVTAPAGDNAGQYHSVDSPRVLDTRDGSNTGLCPTSTSACVTIPAGGSLSVQVAGEGGIPGSGVAAVALNALAFSAADGQLTVWDGTGSRPDVASLSYSADAPVSNTVVAKLDAAGRVSVWSSAATDVVLDVSGWWSSPSGTAGGELHVLSPTQVLNTVSGSESGLCPTSTAQCATIPAGGTLEATVAGQGGVPSSGVAQVVVNVVAADTSGPGWVTAYGGDDAMPANATAIFDGTGVVSALAVVNVSATGTIKLSSVFASTDVVVEVEGWISAGASAGGTRYVPADSPARVLDTRAGTRAGACPAATVECTSLSGGPRTVQIAGQGPVPAGVSSVLASVTVFGAASVGVLQAYPAGGSAPGGLSMVFNGGVPVTQLVALALNADGQVELLSPFTAIDVTIDVVGWNVAATDTWAYGYNPDGLRASKTPPAGSGIGATTFTWDRASGLPMLLAQDQAGVGVTNYLYGPDGLAFEQINPDGTTLWLHHDQLGSTRLVTNAAGTTVGSLTYDAYGNTASSSGTVSNIRLRFAGEYLDSESGLYYLRNRFYDPGTGQFLTRDPLVGATRSAYGYAGHDPLNAIDPSGLSVGPESWWDAEAQVANFAGGLLDSVTLGNGKRILNAVGQGDKVDACSGWFTAGERTGLVIQLAFAVAELKGATAAAEAPRSAPDFVAGPIGSGPPVPVSQSRMAAGFDAAGFPSTRTVSAGVEYTLPDGSLVRLMQPSGEAPLRASFTNANGGYINPFTGKPVQPPAPSGWSMKDWVRALAHVGQTP